MRLLVQNQNNRLIHIQRTYSYGTYDQQTVNEKEKVDGIQRLKNFTKRDIICRMTHRRKILVIQVAKGNIMCPDHALTCKLVMYFLELKRKLKAK